MGAERDPSAVIDRLVTAVNHHDLDGLVDCFGDDYLNETPVHPQRGFRGSEQGAEIGPRSSPPCPSYALRYSAPQSMPTQYGPSGTCPVLGAMGSPLGWPA